MADLMYRSVDLHRCDARTIELDLVEGFDTEAEVSGRDVLIPGRPGMYSPTGSREKRRRIIRLKGYVQGVGTSDTDREQSYRDLVDDLHAIFDPTLEPADLIVAAPYLGLASGTMTLSEVRFLNTVWGPLIRRSFRTLDVEMESIANPPDWQSDGSSP